MSSTGPVSTPRLPSRIYPPDFFVDNSTPVGIFYTNPRADSSKLIYNYANGCCYLEGHAECGLIMGVRNDKAYYGATFAATNKEAERHILVCLSPKHDQCEVIIPDNRLGMRTERCFAVVEGNHITTRCSSDFRLLDVGAEYLLIENGIIYTYYSFPRDVGPPTTDELKGKHPGCVLIINHTGREISVLEPLGSGGFNPIASLKFANT